MDKGKIAGGILSLTLVGLAIGYVVATGYLTIRYGLSTQAFDITLLAREYRALGATAPRDFLWVNLILAGFGIAALMLSVTLLGDALTRFGTTHWQTQGEMKRNGFFAMPGGGFLLGKLGPPKSKRPFSCPRPSACADRGADGRARCGLRDPEPAHLQRLGRRTRR